MQIDLKTESKNVCTQYAEEMSQDKLSAFTSLRLVCELDQTGLTLPPGCLVR